MPDPTIFCDLRGMGGRGESLMHWLGKAAEDVTPMDSGDIAFWGLSPIDGDRLYVGMEYKTLRSLITDIKTNRAADQLKRMLNDYDRAWLLIETGKFWIEDGYVAFPPVNTNNGRREPNRFLYSSVMAWLAEIQEWGVKLVDMVFDVRQGARVVLAMYSWYQKLPEDHKLTTSYHQPFVFNDKASLVRRMSACVGDIGHKKSQAVDEHFGSVYDMVTADVKEWRKVPGIGKTIATRTFKEFREPNQK